MVVPVVTLWKSIDGRWKGKFQLATDVKNGVKGSAFLSQKVN